MRRRGGEQPRAAPALEVPTAGGQVQGTPAPFQHRLRVDSAGSWHGALES